MTDLELVAAVLVAMAGAARAALETELGRWLLGAASKAALRRHELEMDELRGSLAMSTAVRTRYTNEQLDVLAEVDALCGAALFDPHSFAERHARREVRPDYGKAAALLRILGEVKVASAVQDDDLRLAAMRLAEEAAVQVSLSGSASAVDVVAHREGSGRKALDLWRARYLAFKKPHVAHSR